MCGAIASSMSLSPVVCKPPSHHILSAMDLDFTEDEIRRYSRHILLQDVGGIGQAKLKAARVLVVGAGGLGSPLALYLAAAGVGTIGIVDHDRVELSNLQRQIAHTTDRIGEPKAESAARAAHAINPEVRIEPLQRAPRRRQRARSDRALRPRLRRHRQFRHPLPGGRRLRAGAPHAGFRRGAALRGPALGVQAASATKAAPAIAACIPSRRPRARCRPAARPACSARSPA